MCQQQVSDGASLWEGKARPDCSITNIQPEVGLERLVDLSTISNRNTTSPGRQSSANIYKFHVVIMIPLLPVPAW